MFRSIITLLLFYCFTLQSIAAEVKLNPEHPQRHTVVKGDTLWGISAKFLKDPWLWPKVWKFNRAQIKNPHLIYPGDVVVLDLSSGQPELKLLRETITLQPGIIEEPLEKKAIPTIPLNAIAPFLNRPLIIEKDELADAPRIVAAKDDRVTLGAGSKIYINKIEENAGLDWFIYRPGAALIDPDTKETLGIEATYLGNARITQYGEPATAGITKSKEEILIKDRLVLSDDEAITNFVPHAPEDPIKGRIIKIYGGIAEAGPQSIVTINKGSIDGIEIGHVLAINRYGKIIQDPEFDKNKAGRNNQTQDEQKNLNELNFDVSRDADGKAVVNFEQKTPKNEDLKLEPGMIKLPDERIGLVMIFRVYDRVAYGLILQASEPVHNLDVVITP